MMDGFNAHILADEASTGGVVVGTGISAALLFFQQSFERMLPYLIIEAVVRLLIEIISNQSKYRCLKF